MTMAVDVRRESGQLGKSVVTVSTEAKDIDEDTSDWDDLVCVVRLSCNSGG
jgi:hypothetical protein